MRIAVVYFAEKDGARLLSLSRGLTKGLESQGHRVDIIDGLRDVNTKLTIYEYIAVGCESLTFFTGRISEKISYFLKNTGMVNGKKCFAFTSKTLFSANRALSRLMKEMEHEGMMLRYSEVLTNPEQAESVGKILVV
jgi:menaquinone-dependent protoporphyrinogen IX oxidase